jgi:hypothetical protein
MGAMSVGDKSGSIVVCYIHSLESTPSGIQTVGDAKK